MTFLRGAMRNVECLLSLKPCFFPCCRIWDLKSGACKLTLKGHNSEVEDVAISSDGKTVVSGSADSTVR